MPIEIRELHIKLNVSAGGQGGGTGQASIGERSAGERASSAPSDELVTQCVEQVMELLRVRQER